MSETTDIYTVSFKAGPQFKEALLVARGNTVPEFEDNIKALHETTLALIAETQSLFLAAAAVMAPVVEDSRPAPEFAQGGGDATVTELRTCAHGKRTKRTGTSSRGAWVGWFCPLPKGSAGQCKAEFE